MLSVSGGNQIDWNSLERYLTPYQYSRLPLTFFFFIHHTFTIGNVVMAIFNSTPLNKVIKRIHPSHTFKIVKIG